LHRHTGAIFDFAALADKVFPGHDSKQQASALTVVFRLGMFARAAENDFPLLPTRYHLAVNCPDGLSVKLDPSDKEGWNKIKLLHRYQEGPTPFYSILTCRKCGQPFFEAFGQAGLLYPRQSAGKNDPGEFSGLVPRPTVELTMNQMTTALNRTTSTLTHPVKMAQAILQTLTVPSQSTRRQVRRMFSRALSSILSALRRT
jgi:hypothetical protein